MIVSRTKDEVLIKKVVTDPILFDLHGGRGQDVTRYKPYLGHLWLEVKHEDELIGICEFRKFTGITYEAHIYILPKFHGTGVSEIAGLAIREFLKNKTNIKQVLVTIPDVCKHSIAFVGKLGFKVSGLLKDGIIYNDELVNLIILQLEV